MGKLTARQFRAMAKFDTALRWHLQHNHYPPHPLTMLPVAKAAIEAVNEDDPDRLVSMPDDMVFKDGREAVEAWRVVESLHLDEFLGANED